MVFSYVQDGDQLGVMAKNKGDRDWVLEKQNYHIPTLNSLSPIEVRTIVSIRGLYIYTEEKP